MDSRLRDAGAVGAADGGTGWGWPRPPAAAALGLAIAFFTLLGSQNDPRRPLETYGLVLAMPAVLLATVLTRRAWIAALFLLLLGIVVRLASLDRDYFGSDVILVTREALGALLDGDNPYGFSYRVSDNPFAYPPGNLLYYLPGYLSDDTRITEIVSASAVLAGLVWVAWLIRSDGPVAALGLYAAAPPLISVATDGSNDTSAGALLFASVLLLFFARRQASGPLLIASGVLMGETLAFKQYALPFWPVLIAYLARTGWQVPVTLPGGRTAVQPAWRWYAGSGAAFIALVGLPFFLWSPADFIDDLTAWSSIDIHPIEGWNVWAYLLEWLDWDAQAALGDLLPMINIGLAAAVVAGSILLGAERPSRALTAGACGWFVLMLFARWTTFSYFAGVAPTLLLIPFVDSLAAERPVTAERSAVQGTAWQRAPRLNHRA